MAESIKKFIIKDAHGGTKEQGSFSVVGEVHVNLVPGYGEPYAESEYVNGILTITIHNIEGNGITEITTDSQEGDEAVNTVTIKTNANPEGVTLEVRNGSKGSKGDKGDKGDQGDSAVYDPSSPDAPDFVMANTTGQSTTKAMTQKAVTYAINKVISYWDGIEEHYGDIGNGVIGDSVTNMYKIIPVNKGDTINIVFPQRLVWYAIISKAPTDTDKTFTFATGWTRTSSQTAAKRLSINVSADNARYLLIQTHVTVNNDSIEAYPASLNIGNRWYLPIVKDNYGTIVPVFSGYINITNSQVTIPSGSRMIVGGIYIQISADKNISYNSSNQSSIIVYNIYTETFTAPSLSDYIYAVGDYILFSIGYGDRLCSLPLGYYKFNGVNQFEEDVKKKVFSSIGWTNGYYIDNNGTFVKDTDWAVTKIIPCVENDAVAWKSGYTNNYVISIVCFDANGRITTYYSVSNKIERTFTCPAGTAYLLASFYKPSANGYLKINNVSVVSLDSNIVNNLNFNDYAQYATITYEPRIANIASTGNTKINITDTTIVIPALLRIVYGKGNVYRLPSAVTVQRVAGTGSTAQSEYVYFDAFDNSIHTIEEDNITADTFTSESYILFIVSNGLSGCSLSFSQYTINGSPAVESNKYNATDIVTQNKHKEAALMATILYRGNTNIKVDNKVSFLFFTDIHGNTTNLERVIKYGNKYSTYLDDVIHGGDSAYQVITDPNPFESVAGGQTILNIAGNHEAWLQNSDTDYLATEKQVYDKIFANSIANWNVVQPTNAATNGYCYYYKDYRNMRLIVLDDVHWHKGGNQQIVDDYTTQKTWFEGVLADAITNNKVVMCAMHYPPRYIVPLESVKGFNRYGTTESTDISDGWYADDLIFDCVDTFINNGGKFIGWMMGHTHNDYIGYVKNHANQPVVVTGTAGAGSTNNKNVVGTNSQDNFNIITFSWIDNSKKLIKILRVGNDMDMYGRSKKSISFNIADGTVLEVE